MSESNWSVVSVGHAADGSSVVTAMIGDSVHTFVVTKDNGSRISRPDPILQPILDRVFDDKDPSDADRHITECSEEIMMAIARGDIGTDRILSVDLDMLGSTSLSGKNPAGLNFTKTGGFSISEFDIGDSNRKGANATVSDGPAVLKALLETTFSGQSFMGACAWLKDQGIEYDYEETYYD